MYGSSGATGAAVPGAGHGREEVERERTPARRVVGDQEAATARARQRRLGDPRGEGRRDARVDGRAARAQDLGADLGRDRMPCRDAHRAAALSGSA